MIIIQEARQLLDWWVVIPFAETQEADDGEYIDRKSDTEITVLAIPKFLKLLTMLFNVIPRTVVCLWLSYSGTNYLVNADGYEDLILNSVALGFLIEVDNMLFQSICSKRDQALIDNCEEIECYHPCTLIDTCYEMVPSALPILVGMFLLAGGSQYWVYEYKLLMGTGYECLCECEGYGCVSAQILGGSAFVDNGTIRVGTMTA
jgi:hypothetical protein